MQTPSHLSGTRSSWWHVARLITFRPGLYSISALGIIGFYLWPLATGALVRRIFDQLSNQALLATPARQSGDSPPC